jgi:hypothetical protein
MYFTDVADGKPSHSHTPLCTVFSLGFYTNLPIVTLLLRTRGVLDSNIGPVTGYPDRLLEVYRKYRAITTTSSFYSYLLIISSLDIKV